MAKDPAFLFYTSDFLTGTMFMTNEQVGLYIRMLCAQHQHGGRIDTNVLRTQCDGITNGDTVFSKFAQDDAGSYNERLDVEIQKRKEKSVKATESVNKRWNSSSSNAYERITNVIRSENENVNEDESVNETGIAVVKKNETAIALNDDYQSFIQTMQEVTGRDFRGDKKSRAQFRARIKDGYTLEDFKRAAHAAASTVYHQSNKFDQLTPELLTRPDKLEAYCTKRVSDPANAFEPSRKINRNQTIGDVDQIKKQFAELKNQNQ
jgi:uncharacterized phage protein (TIGR02220 family)